MAGNIKPEFINGYIAISAATSLATTTTNAPYAMTLGNNYTILVQDTAALSTPTTVYISTNEVAVGKELRVINTTDNIVAVASAYTGVNLVPTGGSDYVTVAAQKWAGFMYYVDPVTGNLAVSSP